MVILENSPNQQGSGDTVVILWLWLKTGEAMSSKWWLVMKAWFRRAWKGLELELSWKGGCWKQLGKPPSSRREMVVMCSQSCLNGILGNAMLSSLGVLDRFWENAKMWSFERMIFCCVWLLAGFQIDRKWCFDLLFDVVSSKARFILWGFWQIFRNGQNEVF